MTMLDMTPLGWLGCTTSTQTNLEETPIWAGVRNIFWQSCLPCKCVFRSNVLKCLYCIWGKPGPSCSKLMMSLVNVSLKLWSLNMAYMLIFLLKKMWVAFAFAKATHIFFSKNTCELDIVLTRTVNILTTNMHVKLTMLWTSGPLIANT